MALRTFLDSSGQEWLAYDVSVAATRNYSLTLRMASAVAGTKTATVSVDGVTVATFNFTGSAGWQAWSNVTVKRVRLAAGNHTVRIGLSTAGFNLNWLDVTAN